MTKNTVHIDYRPGKALPVNHILDVVYNFFTAFPNLAVEAVSVRTHHITDTQLANLLAVEILSGISVKVVFEHTQITFMKKDNEQAQSGN